MKREREIVVLFLFYGKSSYIVVISKIVFSSLFLFFELYMQKVNAFQFSSKSVS